MASQVSPHRQHLEVAWPQHRRELNELFVESRLRAQELAEGRLSDYWLGSWFHLLCWIGEKLTELTRRYRLPRFNSTITSELRAFLNECRDAVTTVKAEARERGVSLIIPASYDDPEPWVQEIEARSRRLRVASARGGATRKGQRSPVRRFIYTLLEQIQGELERVHRAETAQHQHLSRLRGTSSGRRGRLRIASPPLPKVSAKDVWRRLGAPDSNGLVARAAKTCGIHSWSLGEYQKILNYRTAKGSHPHLTYKSIENEVTFFHKSRVRS